jgi:hypothetical protein
LVIGKIHVSDRFLVTIDCVVTASSSRKRSHYFIGVHNEALSVGAMRVSYKDRAPVAIQIRNAAPTPSGLAEPVSYDFPVLNGGLILPLLLSTQQSQNDMKGRNARFI